LKAALNLGIGGLTEKVEHEEVKHHRSKQKVAESSVAAQNKVSNQLEMCTVQNAKLKRTFLV
jgi:hypothetical protein